MPTPLEGQILDDFEERLSASDLIPVELAQKLMAHARSDSAPTADVLLSTFKGSAGDTHHDPA